MGVDASSDAAARDALAELRAAERDRRIDPVRVVRMDAAGVLQVRSPSGRWRVDLQLENGDVEVLTGNWNDAGPHELRLTRLATPGYHRLWLSTDSGGKERVDEQT